MLFTTLLFWRAMPMFMPVAHAPIEKALMVIHGSSPKAYRAKWLMKKWLTCLSSSDRIQLKGVPVLPDDSSIAVAFVGSLPFTHLSPGGYAMT